MSEQATTWFHALNPLNLEPDEAKRPAAETPLFKALSAHPIQTHSPQDFIDEANTAFSNYVAGCVFTAGAVEGSNLLAVVMRSSTLHDHLLGVQSRDRLYAIIDEMTANWKQLTTTNKTAANLNRQFERSVESIL